MKLFQIIALCMVAGLAACSPAKRAAKQLKKDTKAVERIHERNSAMLATKTRAWFPCIISGSDTIVTVKDSILYVECPPMPEVPIDFAIENPTPVKPLPNKPTGTTPGRNIIPVNVPDVVNVEVTHSVEDSAKVKESQHNCAIEVEAIQKLYRDEVKAHKRTKTFKDILLGAVLFTTALAGLFLFLYKKR